MGKFMAASLRQQSCPFFPRVAPGAAHVGEPAPQGEDRNPLPHPLGTQQQGCRQVLGSVWNGWESSLLSGSLSVRRPNVAVLVRAGEQGTSRKEEKQNCMWKSRNHEGKFFMSKHWLAACFEGFSLNNIRKAVAWILPVGAFGRSRKVPQLLLHSANKTLSWCSCLSLFLEMETSALLLYSALLHQEGCQKEFSFCAPFSCDLNIYSSKLCSTFPAKPSSPDWLDFF